MGQFLTKLDRPKLWNGYPFLLSAAIGDIEDDLILVIKVYNVDGSLATTQQSTPASYINSVIDFDITQLGGSYVYPNSYLIVHIESSLGEVLTDTLTIDIIQPCENPVYLIGRNSLGGVLSWMFDMSQDYSFDYGNQRKAKRLILTSVNTTVNQWESLQDFITLGEVYRNNIVEFTSSTIKTSTRIDQQIYVVGSDGSKIGVIAIPVKNKTKTKQIKHLLELEIEYPETF